MEDYSTRQMSNETDKLPAIVGVAKQMPVARLGRYLGGMWESELLANLLWKVAVRCPRPSTYIAPSWSWAALLGGVIKPLYYELIVAQLVGVYSTPMLQDDFGQVAGASMTLSATMFPIRAHSSHELSRWFIDDEDHRYLDIWNFMSLDPDEPVDVQQLCIGTAILDFKLNAEWTLEQRQDYLQNLDLRCILIAKQLKDPKEIQYGALVVTPSKRHQDAFERFAQTDIMMRPPGRENYLPAPQNIVIV